MTNGISFYVYIYNDYSLLNWSQSHGIFLVKQISNANSNTPLLRTFNVDYSRHEHIVGFNG